MLARLKIDVWLRRVQTVLVGWSALSGLQLLPLPAAVLAWIAGVLIGFLTNGIAVAQVI